MLRKLINAVKSQVQRLEVQKELLQEMQSARIRAGIKTFHAVFDTIHGVEILVCNDTVLGYTGLNSDEPACVSGKGYDGKDYIYINDAVKHLPEDIYQGLIGNQLANVKFKINDTDINNELLVKVRASSPITQYKCDQRAVKMGYDMYKTLSYLYQNFSAYRSHVVQKRIQILKQQ